MTPLSVAATLATLLLAGTASAQDVRGTALDRDLGRPLAGAALLLVDSTGQAVDSVRAGAHGEFLLRARGPGRYFVHVQLDGWAGVPSDPFDVTASTDVDVDVRVPLIGGGALRQMSSILDDASLQRPLPEICGEELRPWEAGVLVGVVRDRRSRQPVPAARVWATGDGTALRSTVSNDRGNYILCNLPADGQITVAAESADGRSGEFEPEIQRGVVAWYDVFIRGGGERR